MENCEKSMIELSKEFQSCQRAFTAIGDETRQNIIITLLESNCTGIRVGEITERTHLSRPAVSHHLKILKEAKIVGMRREGTRNYYYLNTDENQFKKLLVLFQHIDEIIQEELDTESIEDDF